MELGIALLVHCIFTFGHQCNGQVWPKLFGRDRDTLSIDGSWSSWQSWSPCYNNTRDVEKFYVPWENFLIQSRNRTCTSPRPLHGGKDCIPPSHRFRQCSCTNPLGMTTGRINDNDITSNRILKGYLPSHARFGENYTGWCAKKLSYLRESYIQIDFENFANVGAITTVGVKNGRIQQYRLEYSLNGEIWKSVNDRKIIYKGNTLPGTFVRNNFASYQVMKYLRLIPTDAFRFPCLKMELYGCIFTCGELLTQPFGEVIARSSEYIDQNCLWRVEVRNTTSLSFDFNVFYIMCEHGYLDFHDGSVLFTESTLLKRICLHDEDEEIPILKLNYNSVWLNFVSNSSSTEVGFNIKYFEECSQVIQLKIGEAIDIMSPNFPNNYFDNLECMWTVLAPNSSSKFEIHVNQFEIESSRDVTTSCPDDVLTIKNKRNDIIQKIGSYCNSYKPPNVMTVEGQELVITFISDLISSEKGFSLTIISGSKIHPTTFGNKAVTILKLSTQPTIANNSIVNVNGTKDIDKNKTMLGKKIRNEESDDTWTVIIICVFTAFALLLFLTVAGMNIKRYIQNRNDLNAQCAKILEEEKKKKKRDKIEKANKEFLDNKYLLNKPSSPTKVTYKDPEKEAMLSNVENHNNVDKTECIFEPENSAADVIDAHISDIDAHNDAHNDTLDDVDGNVDSSSYDSSSPQIHSPLKTEVVIDSDVELHETIL